MAGTLGTAILGNTLLDILSTGNCNVATFGNQSSNLQVRFYDSNLPFAAKNYTVGLCNVDTTYARNAFYITANQSNMTRIGIGTAFPATTMEIEGVDALRVPYGTTAERPAVPKQGQIRYNATIDQFEGYGTGNIWAPIGGGGGSTWIRVVANVPNFVLSSGTFATTSNIVLKRYGNNDITLQVYIDGRVTVKPTGGADYRINLTDPLYTTNYPVSLTVGEMWLVSSNINTGAIAEYKALAKSIPGDSTYVAIKYLNGTTEASLGDFNVGQNLTLQGTISYQNTLAYGTFNSNYIMMTGTNVDWVSSFAPYPYLSAPAGGALTQTYRQGLYRHFGSDMIHNVLVEATLDTQPANTDLNYLLNLQWPVDLSQYTSNSIVGEFWLRASYGGLATSYKAYAQTNGADSNTVLLRYANGTYDQSLADITPGTTVRLQGTLTYKTTYFSSVYIPTQYLPNRLYQDGDGKVAINNAGGVVRARWEVIETSNYPAVLIDQRSGADIAQFRSNTTDIKAIINAKGNVGIGTSMAPHPMTVWGGMMFNGTMYDVYGNPLWIPGSSVNWQSTPSAPVITVPAGGTWVVNAGLTTGAWRYIGNEVNYNVAITGTMTVAPTNPAANFKLSLPAPLKLSAYASVPGGAMSNIILGELWANIAYGTNSNMFKSYAMVEPSDSNVVALRVLSGTTDTTFSTMTAPSLLTLRGQINYTTTSNIVSLSLPSTGVPANFKQDQYGRVTLNTNNPARGQFDIVVNSNVPALVVDQAGTGDIMQMLDAGVVKNVVDSLGNVGIGTTVAPSALTVVGDVSVSGSISAGNTMLFRNRVINGDMRIDQRNGGGNAGVGVGGSANAMAITYTVDRFAIANSSASGTMTAKQVSLSAADQAAIGGFTNKAVLLSPTPVDGLTAYFPFDSNILDTSGNGVVLTQTGSVSYVPGRVGSNAVYLANTVTQSSASTNSLTSTYNNFIQPFTVSFWFNATSIPVSTSPCMFITSITNLTNAVAIYIDPTKLWIAFNNIANNGGTTTTISINTWYHVCVTYIGTTLTLYLNGSVNGNTLTGTCVSNGFMISPAVAITGLAPFAGFIDDFRIYNRALSATEIAALANVAPICATPAITVASGLTSWLKFDSNTTDTQGTLGAPTVTGTTTYSPISKSGTACLDLTANTAGSTTITTALSYAYTANTLPITVSCWINPSTVGVNYQIPVSTSTNGSTTGFLVSMSSSGVYGWITIGGVAYSTNIVAIVANTWVHVCFTAIHSGYIHLYINGVLSGTSSVLPASGTMGAVSYLRIGSMTSALYAYKGLIDDVRIYNRVLSPQEVAGLYHSYTPQPYMVFQQTIEGQNVADLAWGTSAAQPATVSAWIKNNTATSQAFALSVANAGAAAISAITFETSSGINDTLGFLTNATGTNVVYATGAGLYKVGTQALDLSTNTAGGTATRYILYNTINVNISITSSCWIYPSVVNTGMVFISFGSTSGSWAYNGNINASGQVYFDAYISGTNYLTTASSATSITAGRWTHICSTIQLGGTHSLYINGVLVNSVSISTATNLICADNTPITIFNIGRQNARPTTTAYQGYIDDVRIYNRALSATEVATIYATNATATTISPYLLPRSLVYTTPAITAGSWYNAKVTVPAETAASTWGSGTDAGLVVGLCLGAGSNYVAPTTQTWASVEYLTGSNVQVWGESANNFLALPTNQILLTGVQLEKGTLGSAFEVRPFAAELQLCQRYYETIVIDYTGYYVGNSSSITKDVPYKIQKRVAPQLVLRQNFDTSGTWTSVTDFQSLGIAVSIVGNNGATSGMIRNRSTYNADAEY